MAIDQGALTATCKLATLLPLMWSPGGVNNKKAAHNKPGLAPLPEP